MKLDHFMKKKNYNSSYQKEQKYQIDMNKHIVYLELTSLKTEK